jgi:hypothetical protein
LGRAKRRGRKRGAGVETLWISDTLKFRNVLREVMLRNIRLEELVIGFQELVIVFLVLLLLFDQLKEPKAPCEQRPPADDSAETKNRTADPEKEK